MYKRQYLACFISNSLCLEKFYVPITSSVELSFNTVIPLVLIGIAFGLTGLLFSKGLAFGKKKAKSLIESPYKRIFFMAIPLAAILFFALGGRYCGLGTNLISNSFHGGDIYSFDWIVKLALTIFTLSIGFQGGEVTPLFSIGASPVSYTHLIPQPAYVSYEPCTIMAGGKPVIIDLKAENEFRLTPEELEAAITPKTKVLILPFPNNCLLYTSRCV